MNRVAAALVGAAVTAGTAAVLRSRAPSTSGGAQRWRRTNYRGREVDLLGGVATATGAVAGCVAAGGTAGAAAALVSATGGVLGALDDADTSSTSKGLRGHLGALSRGEVTTGALKLVGISTAALAAAALATGGGRRGASDDDVAPVPARVLDVCASGVLVAGTANLVNLLDLRPGRALKAVGLAAVPLALTPGAAGRLAGAALGAVAASWDDDLAEETMLGDAGANALGAVLGTALACVGSSKVRGIATGVVVALVLASEKVSFSQVIASTPGLRELDEWARTG
jgi:UDP-N-acetylmuramyl pentapeptide phosphotransferase/UDP-N-acetylglucosamine-1-phosphate transferase